MLFNSFHFLVFFPIVVAVYFVIPKKWRYLWLLITSYYFYMSWNPKYALLMLASTIITYATSIFISRASTPKMKKYWVIFSLVSNLGILAVFKYANFIFVNIDHLLSVLHLQVTDYHFDLLLPVGISFYTFQALSYTLDVYRQKIAPEKNFLKYALYVSFFPQLVAGPIERSENLLPQIQKCERLNIYDWEQVKKGVIIAVFGFFEKLVIADRIAPIVNNIFAQPQSLGLVEGMLGLILFAWQIYTDFDGYSHIAIGCAQILGFQLTTNFRQPYLATCAHDFWRRWHITLTSWFTQYLYIPLGGNRKGLARKYLNIMIVFAVSGLWHGAAWHFVIWGLINGLWQICSDLKLRAYKHLHWQQYHSWSQKLRQIACTFIITCAMWSFFIVSSAKSCIQMWWQMIHQFYADGLEKYGLDKNTIIILLISIGMLMTVDVLKEKNIDVVKSVTAQETWYRHLIYIVFLVMIILFGIYGPDYDASKFIYFDF